MGTDITFCVEQKIDGIWTFVPGSDKWYGDNRSYSFFTALCGARSEMCAMRGEDIAPMGPMDHAMPSDVSAEVREMCGDEYAGESGCTTRSLTDLLDYEWSEIPGTDKRELWDRMSALGPPEDVRAIFWFSW